MKSVMMTLVSYIFCPAPRTLKNTAPKSPQDRKSSCILTKKYFQLYLVKIVVVQKLTLSTNWARDSLRHSRKFAKSSEACEDPKICHYNSLGLSSFMNPWRIIANMCSQPLFNLEAHKLNYSKIHEPSRAARFC